MLRAQHARPGAASPARKVLWSGLVALSFFLLPSLSFAATGDHAASVYLSAHQTVSASTNTVIGFDSVEFDTDSEFNTSTHQYTPTAAGYYLVTANLRCQNDTAGGQCYLRLRKNGVLTKQTQLYAVSSNDDPQVDISTVLYLNGTTDYVDIQGNTGGTTFGGGVVYYTNAQFKYIGGDVSSLVFSPPTGTTTPPVFYAYMTSGDALLALLSVITLGLVSAKMIIT